MLSHDAHEVLPADEERNVLFLLHIDITQMGRKDRRFPDIPNYGNPVFVRDYVKNRFHKINIIFVAVVFPQSGNRALVTANFAKLVLFEGKFVLETVLGNSFPTALFEEDDDVGEIEGLDVIKSVIVNDQIEEFA